MNVFLSDQMYMAIKPETTAGVAVIPTVFVPLISTTLETVLNHTADRRIKGVNWGATGLLRGNRMHEGEIVIYADPDMLGHVLNMTMLLGSSSGNGTDGYTHPFTVGAPQSYTIEFRKGIYAQRFFGVHVDELKLTFEEGKFQVSMSVKAMGQFSVGALGVALSGSVTSLIFDDEYDVNPTRGLVVGDVLVIGTDEVTITAVDADGISVDFSSASLTYSVGEPIYLKPLSATLPAVAEPFFFGNFLIGLGADESAATTAAGSRSTAIEAYDLEITFKNNLFAQNGSSRMDPVQIHPQTRECQIVLKQLHETEDQREKLLNRGKQAMTMIATGKNIKADFTTFEKLTAIFNHVKLLEDPNVINAGELIKEEQTFEVLYDSSDAQAMELSLVNRTAGSAY